ncbi:CHAT domain-containing tetratricopeptide repeat protein [Novosphingobium kaempferiae]|uniref:CHAT domain-containing tetratricopeptide repeat protein n=1 Tax=Novosphingobium kaempferiae TaxID=2896849 RepID=UPI001E5A9427|nr:CHAT domain-containing tetratricopeptide repeat protein [Novosphingobium kaempferiae]
MGTPLPAAAQSVAERITASRALAAQCRIPDALTGAQAALTQARTEWPAGNPQLALLLVDTSSLRMRLGDLAGAEADAREAIGLTQNAGASFALLFAVAQLRLADALMGQDRLDDAAAPLQAADRHFRETAPDMAVGSAIASSRLAIARGLGAEAVREAQAAVQSAGTAQALLAQARLQLAEAYRYNGQITEAGQVLATLGPGTASDGRLALARAGLAFDRGQFHEALALTSAADKALDPATLACDRTLRVDLLQRRASIHLLRREVSEARLDYDAALLEHQRVGIAHSPRKGEIYFGLADAAYLAGEYPLASSFFDRSSAAFRDVYGGPSAREAEAEIERAFVLEAAGDAASAITTVERGLAMLATVPGDHTRARAGANAALGRCYRQQKRIPEAKAAFAAAIGGFERARGKDSADLPPGLVALGEIALDEGKPEVAMPLLQRALAIQRGGGSMTPQSAGLTLSRIAAAHAAMAQMAAARKASSEAVGTLEQRLNLGEDAPWADAEAERRRSREILQQDLDLAFTASGAIGNDLVNPAFRTAQLASSISTGAAIAQMSRRLQANQGPLAEMLRRRDDLVQEWKLLDTERNRQLARSDPDSAESPQAEQRDMLQRQSAILAELSRLDLERSRRFPQSDLVVRSLVVDLADVQSVLKDGELALTFAVMDKRTYVFWASREAASAYAVDMGRDEMSRLVADLRASIAPPPGVRQLPVFDAMLASRLYERLLRPALDAAPEAKTLLVVPDGALSSIPLGVLVSQPPAAAIRRASDFLSIEWVAKRHAIGVFPSAASTVALRRLKKGVAPSGSFLGVGDPELSGKAAVNAQIVLTRSLGRTRLADPSILSGLTPLPESRSELEQMASALGAGSANLMVGAAASERAIKTAPLADYRVLAFATHGLVAGDLAGYAEAALVLTPPAVASDQDDGLLSASEIAGLRLNADWVILSACNTAAGSDGHAEPLTGLAKAFFHAGVRSLLVSHWQVDSKATVALTTQTVRNFASGQSSPEALRATEMTFADGSTGAGYAHPFFWAAFSVIGFDN